MMLRLLPWTGHDGQPCFLDTDRAESYLSRLADNLEAVQLGMAGDLLGHVTKAMAENELADTELRMITTLLCEGLRDALRVAESRGARLPLPDDLDDEATLAASAVMDREIIK